jgi:excisionase family DNA binding protein
VSSLFDSDRARSVSPSGGGEGATAQNSRSSAKNRPEVPRLALSPDEVAASLGVSRDYLEEHIAHELRWVRRGRRKFVAVAELERWLDREAALTLEGR